MTRQFTIPANRILASGNASDVLGIIYDYTDACDWEPLRVSLTHTSTDLWPLIQLHNGSWSNLMCAIEDDIRVRLDAEREIEWETKFHRVFVAPAI